MFDGVVAVVVGVGVGVLVRGLVGAWVVGMRGLPGSGPVTATETGF
jgi:hypothetical protein